MSAAHDLTITGWRSYKDPAGTSERWSHERFLSWVRQPVEATDKLALRGFSLAKFDGDQRALDHVLSVHAVALDDDSGEHDVEATAAAWAQFSGVTYSSFSSTPERPRTRTILFTTRPMDAAEYTIVWQHVRDLARGLGIVLDEQTKDASRLWFVPAVRPDATFYYCELDGHALDVDAVLYAHAHKMAAPEAIRSAKADEMPVASSSTSRRELAARLLGDVWPPDGQRDGAQLDLSGALFRDGWTEEDSIDFLCAVCRIAGDENREKRTATVKSTRKRAKEGKTIAGWPALAKHVDPVVVDIARGLLKADADFIAQMQSECGATDDAPDNVADTTCADGLGFQFGSWDVEPPPVDFLVDGLIPRGAVGLVFGRADAMKTWLLYSMAISLASGVPWLGFKCDKVKVGIVDYETGKANTRRRLFYLRAGSNPNLGAVSFTKLKPNDPAFWKALATHGFQIVIVDSLRRSNPGADENDSADAIKPLELAAEFSEATGCAVLFIHHAKKASGDGWPEFRGSGAIEDQVDCAFAVRKTDVSADRKRVEVRCEKPGDMKTPDPFAVDVDFDDDAKLATMRRASKDTAPKEAETTESQIRAAIRLALANGPIPTKAKIKEEVRGERSRVYREIDAMKKIGEIADIVDVGFVLDGAPHRTVRVLEQVRSYDHWTSTAKLAKASHVPTAFVEKMLRDHVIVPRASGGDVGGFIEMPRDNEAA